MIIKRVKEYGKKTKRQRIDINKNDGFEDGQEVALLTIAEYEGINQNMDNLKKQLRNCENELYSQKEKNKIYESQEQNLKKIIEDTTAPISDFYNNELESKDAKIKQLEEQYKALLFFVGQNNLELMQYGAFDKLRGKDKKHIIEFNKKIKLLDSADDDADIESIIVPGESGSSGQDD